MSNSAESCYSFEMSFSSSISVPVKVSVISKLSFRPAQAQAPCFLAVPQGRQNFSAQMWEATLSAPGHQSTAVIKHSSVSDTAEVLGGA